VSKFTTWVLPCPECDYREHYPSGFLKGPEFHETGDICPACKAQIRIKIRDQGSPLAYAYAEAVK